MIAEPAPIMDQLAQSKAFDYVGSGTNITSCFNMDISRNPCTWRYRNEVIELYVVSNNSSGVNVNMIADLHLIAQDTSCCNNTSYPNRHSMGHDD